MDPDPHGFGFFAWIRIRNYFSGSVPNLLFRIRIHLNMKEQINKNVISL